MNKSLQYAFKDYLDNGNDILLSINDENINKYTSETNMKFPSCDTITDNLHYLNISTFYENDDYRHFDLIEGSNHLVYNPEAYIKPMSDEYYKKFLHEWENSLLSRRVCISHKNCHDGLGVKAVVDYHCSDFILNFNGIDAQIRHIELDYDTYDFDQLCIELKGKIVYVGDFSFKKEQLDRLMGVTDMIVVVDHHLTAFQNETSEYENVHIDMGYSGAMLTWRFFYSNQKPPYIISLIEDRDLWNWFYGDKTKACNIAIKRNGLEFIIEYITEDDYKAFTTLNRILVPYIKEVEQLEESYIEKAITAKPYTIAGITFHGINVRSGVSEICNYISKKFNTPSFAYWEDENGLFQISFRDATGTVDVASIARMFAGGGHKAASGSRIKFTDIQLKNFFIDKTLVTKYIVDDEIAMFFANLNIGTHGYINTRNCMECSIILQKTFDELFVVEKDKDNGLVLKLNKGSVK